MLSRIIAFPFMVGLIIAGYMAFEYDPSYSKYIIPNVLALAAIYMLSPQIDWWWYKRNPPELDDQMKDLLKKNFPWYLELSPENKKAFGDRLGLYIMGTEFIPKVFEVVPEEVKGFIAASLIRMTMGKNNYRLPKFERVVVYPTAFLSPQHPKKWHASEIFEEDGVVIFSIEQLIPGCENPKRSYNVAMHEFAKVFMLEYPNLKYPTANEDTWEDLHKISKYSKKYLDEYIGLEQSDPLPVMINHFFNFSKEFQEVLPKEFDLLKLVFNIDPSNQYEPVLDKSGLKSLAEVSGV